jgi:hypothetical protein
MEPEHTIFRTRGEHANLYTNESAIIACGCWIKAYLRLQIRKAWWRQNIFRNCKLKKDKQYIGQQKEDKKTNNDL